MGALEEHGVGTRCCGRFEQGLRCPPFCGRLQALETYWLGELRWQCLWVAGAGDLLAGRGRLCGGRRAVDRGPAHRERVGAAAHAGRCPPGSARLPPKRHAACLGLFCGNGALLAKFYHYASTQAAQDKSFMQCCHAQESKQYM